MEPYDDPDLFDYSDEPITDRDKREVLKFALWLSATYSEIPNDSKSMKYLVRGYFGDMTLEDE